MNIFVVEQVATEISLKSILTGKKKGIFPKTFPRISE